MAEPRESNCSSKAIVAYLDGELEPAACISFENHLAGCPSCSTEVAQERRLLNQLNAALGSDVEVEMPDDFAKVIAARARADVRGVRDRSERRRATAICLLLVAAVVALSGWTAVSQFFLSPLRAVWIGGTALLGFLGNALYDAGVGIAVISRGIGNRMLFDSRPGSLLLLLILVLAFYMLRRLIAGYHRSMTN